MPRGVLCWLLSLLLLVSAAETFFSNNILFLLGHWSVPDVMRDTNLKPQTTRSSTAVHGINSNTVLEKFTLG
eukprot:COSAG01_NODE_9711_length_2363_cov_64.269876_3_plen_72_part_00